MKAIANDECCGHQAQMKRLIDSLIKEVAEMSLKIKELEKRLDFRARAREEMFVPPVGESLD